MADKLILTPKSSPINSKLQSNSYHLVIQEIINYSGVFLKGPC